MSGLHVIWSGTQGLSGLHPLSGPQFPGPQTAQGLGSFFGVRLDSIPFLNELSCIPFNISMNDDSKKLPNLNERLIMQGKIEPSFVRQSLPLPHCPQRPV